MSGQFTFGHLSDIHLAGYREGATFDLDADIRRELVYDLERVVERSGPLNGLLIGGDVAGKGLPEEYLQAAQWIGELLERFEIPIEHVFCVPGNHDVNWSRIKDDSVLTTVQDALRNCSIDEFDSRLEELLTNGEHCGLVLAGLESYNEFAFQYGCAMAVDQQKWEHTFEFDGLRLHIVGLASAIISGPKDVQSAEESKLALGPQARIGRYRDTFTILLCHHPPSWLRDREATNPFLERAHLQLYGHEHSFSFKRSGAGFRIDAGALHPARDEKVWQPSYNVVSLQRGEGEGEMVVDVYARALQKNQTFGPIDAGEELRREVVSMSFGDSGGLPLEPVAEPPPTDPEALTERQLARRFLALSVDERLTVGHELGLLSAADERLPEGARMRRIFEVARARGELRRLEERICG